MCQSTVSNHQKLWKIHPFLMGKSTISMVIFNSKLLVYQRVYKLGILLSMASKWRQNSLLWKFLSTARPNVTIIPNYRNNFWYWSWEWFQTIYYHSKLLITIIPHMIIVLYITTSDVYIPIYIYICVCINMYIHVHSCTYIYIYPYVTIIHSPFFVHLLPWHPVRFHRFAFRNTVTHRTLW